VNWQVVMVFGAVLVAVVFLAIRVVRRLRAERDQKSGCTGCGLQRTRETRS